MNNRINRAVCLAALMAAGLVALSATPAAAQCSTCATPTVAFFQPAPVAPVVTTWARPGLFDRWRMRRWGVAPAPVMTTWAPQTTAFAPIAAAPVASSWTPHVVGFAPVAAAPVATSWAPHVTAFAPLPLRSSVVQTTFMPVVSDGCSTCGQTSCGCATAVLRPVCPEPACTTCNFGCSSCSTCSTCATEAPCSACSSSVAQVVASQPTVGCSSCAGTVESPATPQPQMTPQEAAPAGSAYPGIPVAPENSAIPDPAPAADDASTYFAPPQLLGPTNDRTANRPTVDVRNAVYHVPAKAANVSTSVAKPVTGARTQAQIDAEGWESVPAAR